MSIYSMYYFFSDISDYINDLMLFSLSLLFVVTSFISRRLIHIIQAIALAGIAIYDSSSVFPVIAYLSMYIMSLSGIMRSYGLLRRGIITNPLTIKSLMWLTMSVTIICCTQVLVMIMFYVVSALRIDPVFDLFSGAHNCL